MNPDRNVRIPAATSIESRARLTLEPSGSREGMLDGAWWPRSRDPLSELPALIGDLTTRLGTVYRIGLNHGTWDTQPRRIITGGHVVKLGWYGPTDAHAVRVFGDRRHHLDLLLIPPETAAASAEAAMATASDPTSHARASEVLTAHGISTDIADRPMAPAVEPSADPPEVVTDTPAPVRLPRTAPLTEAAANGATRVNGTRPHPLPRTGTAGGRQA